MEEPFEEALPLWSKILKSVDIEDLDREEQRLLVSFPDVARTPIHNFVDVHRKKEIYQSAFHLAENYRFEFAAIMYRKNWGRAEFELENHDLAFECLHSAKIQLERMGEAQELAYINSELSGWYERLGILDNADNMPWQPLPRFGWPEIGKMKRACSNRLARFNIKLAGWKMLRWRIVTRYESKNN